MKLGFFLLLILINLTNLLSQSNTYNVPSREREDAKIYNTFLYEKDFTLGLSFSKINASSYYDLDGNIVSIFLDTAYLGKYNRLYIVEFEKLTFDLLAKKKILENLFLEFKLPISRYSIYEKYLEVYDSINVQTIPKEDKANLNLFIIDYLEARSIYKLYKGQFDLDFAFTFRLPFGSENGVANNSREFWSDNAIELIPEFRFGLNLQKFNLGLGLAYNYRAEDLKDRLLAKLYFGLYSIPDTYISANLVWANSFDSFDYVQQFNPRKEPSIENFFEANFFFGILLTNEIGIDFSYKIKLLGKNSWNYFGYNIGISYNL